jgi:hypothetical protein
MRHALSVLAVAGLALAGCSGPRVISGDPNFTLVRANGIDVALQLASEHCGRYGRVPRLMSSEPDGTGMIYYRYACL